MLFKLYRKVCVCFDLKTKVMLYILVLPFIKLNNTILTFVRFVKKYVFKKYILHFVYYVKNIQAFIFINNVLSRFLELRIRLDE